jgi:hypothetical protein
MVLDPFNQGQREVHTSRIPAPLSSPPAPPPPPGGQSEKESHDPGPIEKEVMADLERLGKLNTGVRGSLASVALKLARALDGQPDDAAPTTTARLSQELRTTLLAIMGVNTNDGSLVKQLFGMLQQPTLDATE